MIFSRLASVSRLHLRRQSAIPFQWPR